MTKRVNAENLNEIIEEITQNEKNDNRNMSIRLPSYDILTEDDDKYDFHKIIFLIILYFLQGIVLGLTFSVTFILPSRNASYIDQAVLALAYLPYTIKVLWAPVIDSIYWRKIGRRKSWIIPMQFILGILLMSLSEYICELLNESKQVLDSSTDIRILMIIFMLLNFLNATVDIAIDGWAVCLISNSWATTCNFIGQNAGGSVSLVFTLILDSKNFCNNYIRPCFGLPEQNYGLVNLDKFLTASGFLFMIITLLVLLFEKENQEYELMSLKDCYKKTFNIFKIGPIMFKLILIILTFRIPFCYDTIIDIKLIEIGFTKENLSLLKIPVFGFQSLLIIIISQFTNGPKSLNIFIYAIPFRLLMGLVLVGMVYVTGFFKDRNNELTSDFYLIYIFAKFFYEIFSQMMFVPLIAFFPRICDKNIGGTFITLLYSFVNLGELLARLIILNLANLFTFKQCSVESLLKTTNLSQTDIDNLNNLISEISCSNSFETMNCLRQGGFCSIQVDPFYIETFVFSAFGIIWIVKFYKIIQNIQTAPKEQWKIKKTV